jgi:hypothetical protein
MAMVVDQSRRGLVSGSVCGCDSTSPTANTQLQEKRLATSRLRSMGMRQFLDWSQRQAIGRLLSRGEASPGDRDASQQVVYCVAVLHHLLRGRAARGRLGGRRVLRPAG